MLIEVHVRRVLFITKAFVNHHLKELDHHSGSSALIYMRHTTALVDISFIMMNTGLFSLFFVTLKYTFLLPSTHKKGLLIW